MTTTNRCGWPGCKTLIAPLHWGCLEHWVRLPEGLRSALSKAKFRLGRHMPLEGRAPTSPEWTAAKRSASVWAKRANASEVQPVDLTPSSDPAEELGVSYHPVAHPCCFGVGEHKPGCRHAPRGPHGHRRPD